MTTAAARQRAYRLREKLGLVVLPVEVDEHGFAKALIDTRYISEADATDREKLAAAVERLLEDVKLAVMRHGAKALTWPRTRA